MGIVLETERLLLREISEDDCEDIIRLRGNPDVYRFFKSPHKISREEHMNWFECAYLQDPTRIDFVAILSTDKSIEKNNCIGIFGIRRLRNEQIRSNTDTSVEISYLLDSNYTGHGYANECVRRLMKYAITEWHPRRFIATISKENRKSIEFIVKLGFEKRIEEKGFVVYGYAINPDCY